MRLLLVEDEPEIAKALAQGLSEASYTVDVADNGMAGRRFIETVEYDLIILDVMLPGLNGWQLLQQIRELGATVMDTFQTMPPSGLPAVHMEPEEPVPTEDEEEVAPVDELDAETPETSEP